MMNSQKSKNITKEDLFLDGESEALPEDDS